MYLLLHLCIGYLEKKKVITLLWVQWLTARMSDAGVRSALNFTQQVTKILQTQSHIIFRVTDLLKITRFVGKVQRSAEASAITSNYMVSIYLYGDGVVRQNGLTERLRWAAFAEDRCRSSR